MLMLRGSKHRHTFCTGSFRQSPVERGERELFEKCYSEVGGVVGAETIFPRQTHHLRVVARTGELQWQSAKPCQCRMNKIGRNPLAFLGAQENTATSWRSRSGATASSSAIRAIACSAVVFSSSGSSHAPAIEGINDKGH